MFSLFNNVCATFLSGCVFVFIVFIYVVGLVWLFVILAFAVCFCSWCCCTPVWLRSGLQCDAGLLFGGYVWFGIIVWAGFV